VPGLPVRRRQLLDLARLHVPEVRVHPAALEQLLVRALLGDPAVTRLFERRVSRAWRLSQAVISGARHLRPAAKRAEAEVESLCQNDLRAAQLAESLVDLLDDIVRTSSASECVNSILAHYLWARRHFKNRITAQYYLNLVILWHNMRRFKQGKRKGKSPFEIAGVRVFDPDGNETDDWLTALGYPPAS